MAEDREHMEQSEKELAEGALEEVAGGKKVFYGSVKRAVYCPYHKHTCDCLQSRTPDEFYAGSRTLRNVYKTMCKHNQRIFYGPTKEGRYYDNMGRQL